MRKVLLLLALVGLVLVGFVPAAGADPASRPFKAVQTGTLTFVPDAICTAFGIRTNGASTGTVSHLGFSAFTNSHCSSEGDIRGSGTMVAADGDEVFIDYATEATPLPPTIGDVYTVPGTFEITGGTGRFEGAVGRGDLTVSIVFEGLDVDVWPETVVWEGTIGY